MPADITELTISTTDITVLTAAPATINTVSLAYGNSAPQAVGRTASVGSANTVSRSDHVHSAADLLVDGGNY